MVITLLQLSIRVEGLQVTQLPTLMLLLKVISSTVATNTLVQITHTILHGHILRAMPTKLTTHIKAMPNNNHTHLKLSGINTRAINKTMVATVTLTTMRDMAVAAAVIMGRRGTPNPTITANLGGGTTGMSVEVTGVISFMVEEDMTVTMTTGEEVTMNEIATGDECYNNYKD